MTDWLGTLSRLAADGESSVLVTVGRIRGSAPRETGARMIVTRRETIGSIGGGQLEYRATGLACRLLAGHADSGAFDIRQFPLGADCGQCCGGVVDLVFEHLPASTAAWADQARRCRDARVPALLALSPARASGSIVITAGEGHDVIAGDATGIVDDILAGRAGAAVSGDWLLLPLSEAGIDIAVFGAGHVGTAVVDLLARLECRVRWIDSRRRVFPAALPSKVSAIEAESPAREVAAMPPDAYYLVMTHSHPLDLDICHAVLMRQDAAYAGLIGSRSKRRRFEKRLRRLGVPGRMLEDLVCPIGIEGIDGKLPAEIALAAVAEILETRDARRRAAGRPHRAEALA